MSAYGQAKTMKSTLKISVAILLVGCGTNETCGMVYGMCFTNDASDFPLDTELTLALDHLESYFPGLDLEQLMVDNLVTLTFMSNAKNQGTTYFNDIFVQPYQERTALNDCWAQRYVVGHEVIHVISRFHLQVPAKDNQAHTNHAIWSKAVGDDSIEGQYAQYVVDACEEAHAH